MNSKKRFFSIGLAFVMLVSLLAPLGMPTTTLASNPGSGTLIPPAGNGTTSITWGGGPTTMTNPSPQLEVEFDDPSFVACDQLNTICDSFTLHWNAPADYWETHTGGITVELTWDDPSGDDWDLYVYDSEGHGVGKGEGVTHPEVANLGELAPGTYTVKAVPFLVTNSTYTGRATLTSNARNVAMTLNENKDDIMEMLTIDYPVNVIFVGYHPTAQEVADLKRFIPESYKPTVASKSYGSLLSGSGDEEHNQGAGLLNWNKNHYIEHQPFFLGMRYNYVVNIIQASDDYARALFQVAEDNTAQAQSFHSSTRGANLARYDATYGNYRVLAKNGNLAYRVTDATKTDLIDAYAVEDWIFNTRLETRWNCAFRNMETNECLNPSVIQPDRTAYHDPFYDRNGLNLDRMPQGLNKGSSFFFFDTFSPSYSSDYFRPNAYHTWGTDRVINGTIIPRSVEDGGSWRITDPDSGGWDGVDFGRTWGGRYRFHFVDLGAAPNDFESLSWLGAERQLSSDYPHGDPPVWQYSSDPLWRQTGDACLADPHVLDYTGNTPCRMMPRLGRDVAYGLFFRSTAGYLYRPIPRGDVYWLAISNWTDFYSRPQWVNGQLTNAPWYGTWWTNNDILYKINQVGNNNEDVLRWLSSALPYARWVGRKGETIPIYDPTNNQPTNRVLDTSPKYEDLPAPKYHVHQGLTGASIVPEPLYPGDNNQVLRQYGSSTVNLTQLSNAFEKAKARGATWWTYDDAVDHEYMRDYIDANRPGIADVVTGTNGITSFPLVNTIPGVNMVFEKAYTWALPAIVGGIAVETEDNEAWGVLNNVNDRFKWSESHYPAVQPGDPPGSKRSMTDQSLPSQQSGTGFSYTVEHEAAHNLGLSHPHDGSFGVDECPAGSPNAGEWECYWSGLGYMYDISAAPTTYAMSYRPYEVEDQDNLQRGHVVEYLLMSQSVLQERLDAEAAAGRTEPSAGWTGDYNRMREWRSQAVALFSRGDYLHAEYAARNSALAARGFPQTNANTVNPRLLEAGQIYYFTVNPQSDGTQQASPDLIISNIVASSVRPGQTTLTASVSNMGNAPANNVVVRFFDGQALIADGTPIATLAAGGSSQVSISWNTRGQNGEHVVAAVADPANTVAESNEANNRATRVVTIRGNKVTNGSFEQSSGNAPAGWNGSQGTGYDTSGANASDGTKSASATGNGGPAAVLNPAWTSAPIEVTAGQTYNLAVSLKTQALSSAPSLKVVYLDAVGNVLNTVTGIGTNITGTTGMQQVLGQVTIPSGVAQVRLTLSGFNPTDLFTSGTVWFDDVWMWER